MLPLGDGVRPGFRPDVLVKPADKPVVTSTGVCARAHIGTLLVEGYGSCLRHVSAWRRPPSWPPACVCLSTGKGIVQARSCLPACLLPSKRPPC